MDSPHIALRGERLDANYGDGWMDERRSVEIAIDISWTMQRRKQLEIYSAIGKQRLVVIDTLLAPPR